MYRAVFNFYFLFTCSFASAQHIPNGNLFIIGGGDRCDRLMKALVETAGLKKTDYIIVLPMASSEPDSSFFYVKQDLQQACGNEINELNFSKENSHNKRWLDSLQRAKIIFITGGDQNRFMEVVLLTPVYSAIKKAYYSGATIAGTSAGAAVMSREMITGNNLIGDTTYAETFKNLVSKNIEIKEGLGLLTNVIIDQHFVVRSRYNRLLTALAAYPAHTCIGIDEATAIIVHHKKIKVVGESQVIKLTDPKGIKTTKKGLLKFENVSLSVYTDGNSFTVK